MDAPRITFFTRQNCWLCDAALAQLRSALADRPYRLELVDIDRDPARSDEYNHHVPVIWVNGSEVCRHRLDRARLLAALDADA